MGQDAWRSYGAGAGQVVRAVSEARALVGSRILFRPRGVAVGFARPMDPVDVAGLEVRPGVEEADAPHAGDPRVLLRELP